MIGIGSGFPILSKSDKPTSQRSIQTQQEINQLKSIDQDVRAHEMAHKIAGGDLTGPVNYKYVVGPNGKKYAVGGDVSIDVSSGPTPQATIKKMERVIKAALAPVDPSAQDRAVAAQAQQQLNQAQMELSQEGSNVSIYA